MTQITLLLHNIRSTHNVGAIFRTAEGFGVSEIIISGYTPYPTFDGDRRLPHQSRKTTSQINKTALGAESMVPFKHYDTLEEWLSLNRASTKPLPIYGLEQSPKSSNISSFQPSSRFALLLGEEVSGVAADYLDHCDNILEIPMFGLKESFNVSVASGIALYALLQNHGVFAQQFNQSADAAIASVNSKRHP